MSNMPPPPQMVPVPGGRLRGRTAIRVGAVLLILGIALAVVGGVVGFSKSLNKVNDFQRVSVADGRGTVQLSTGGYLAYYEAPGFDTGGSEVPVLAIRITNKASGQNVPYQIYGGRTDNKVKSLTYDIDGHHGAALFQFNIATAGAYLVEVAKPNQSSATANSDIAIGRSIATGIAIGAILALVGVVLFVAGLITLIIGLIRRRGHKKQLAAAYAGGSAQPGYGYPQQNYPPQQAYPPPGYPQQQYPPQQYPGQQYPPQQYPPQGGSPSLEKRPEQPGDPQQPWPPSS